MVGNDGKFKPQADINDEDLIADAATANSREGHTVAKGGKSTTGGGSQDYQALTDTSDSI